MPFGYLNENNPISIGDIEAQEMVNVSIDKDFLEFNKFDTSEKIQNAGRFLYLPNGKEVKINAEEPEPGRVLWRNRGSEDDFVPFYVKWQTNMYPAMRVESNPFANVFDSLSIPNPYFKPSTPGEVFYSVTIYDTQENIESIPFYSHEAVSGVSQNNIIYTQQNIDDNNVVKITLRKPNNSPYNGDRYEYRIYRMAVGGTEYFEVKRVKFSEITTSDGYGSYIYEYRDSVPDERLGSGNIMNTDHLVYEPHETNMNVLALYADKLFIGGEVLSEQTNKNKGILYFSETSEYWKFDASFFFSFVDPVIGLTTFNEMLVVQTTKKLFIIYGDSEDNFVQKEIDFQFDGIAFNSGQPLSSFAYFLATPKDKDEISRVFAFNGSVVSDISQKIINEFNFKFDKTYVLDNRYYIIEKENGEKLVLDTIKIGWCKASEQQYYFSYRTKEFNSGLNGNDFIKQIYVRAKGALLVFVIGENNKVITQRRLYSDKPENHFCYVRPKRFETFSIRFIGYEDTEIYDWGLVE